MKQSLISAESNQQGLQFGLAGRRLRRDAAILLAAILLYAFGPVLGERHKQRRQRNKPDCNAENDQKSNGVNGELSMEKRVLCIAKLKSHWNSV